MTQAETPRLDTSEPVRVTAAELRAEFVSAFAERLSAEDEAVRLVYGLNVHPDWLGQ